MEDFPFINPSLFFATDTVAVFCGVMAVVGWNIRNEALRYGVDVPAKQFLARNSVIAFLFACAFIVLFALAISMAASFLAKQYVHHTYPSLPAPAGRFMLISFATLAR